MQCLQRLYFSFVASDLGLHSFAFNIFKDARHSEMVNIKL